MVDELLSRGERLKIHAQEIQASDPVRAVSCSTSHDGTISCRGMVSVPALRCYAFGYPADWSPNAVNHPFPGRVDGGRAYVSNMKNDSAGRRCADEERL